MKVGSQRLNELAALIACVVEDQGDGRLEMERTEFSEQLANGFGIDVRVVRHGDHFKVERINRAQHVKALTTARCFNPDAGETPQATQKSAKHKVRRIHKKHGALTRFGFG